MVNSSNRVVEHNVGSLLGCEQTSDVVNLGKVIEVNHLLKCGGLQLISGNVVFAEDTDNTSNVVGSAVIRNAYARVLVETCSSAGSVINSEVLATDVANGSILDGYIVTKVGLYYSSSCNNLRIYSWTSGCFLEAEQVLVTIVRHF